MLRGILLEQDEILNTRDGLFQRAAGFAVIPCGPNPPKLPVCGVGTALYLFVLSFFFKKADPARL